MDEPLPQDAQAAELEDGAIDLKIKHPLQDAWTLWYDNPGRSTTAQSWGSHLKKVFSFQTVEDFWCLWNNIKQVNELPSGSSYKLFKVGIEPKWEDKANEKGGKWVYTVKIAQRNTHLPTYWLNLCLAIVGSEFEDSEEIAGIVLCVRRAGDRVEVWTFQAAEEEKCKRIGQKLKEVLGVSTTISYQTHELSAIKSKNMTYTL